MKIIDITKKEIKEFNSIVTHPLQAFEWGEFREKTGIKVVRRGFLTGNKLKSGFQLTIHPIPHTKYNIGYLAKGTLPTKEDIEELIKIGKENKCVFIQLEPNVWAIENLKLKIENLGLRPSAHPLFTKYTFQLDLTKSEKELLNDMHPKTRYNIRVSEKHNIQVKEETSDGAFEEYLKLTKETINRQGFYAHTERYHRLMWETLKVENVKLKMGEFNTNNLSARLLVALHSPSNQLSSVNSQLSTQTLVAWILFVFHETLYYPYGASSNLHREAMASNKMMWEAIKFGKKLGLKKFDMWGALGQNPDPKDPWYGFHRFKEGYGPELIEFVGSFDLVINKQLYEVYKLADKARWAYLKLRT